MSLAYFPMYPTDFDADTGHLTLAEDGAYNRLLRLSWRCPEAKMPNDLDWIFRKVRALAPEDKAVVQSVLDEFFTRKGGKIFSAKLHKIWKQSSEAHDKRVQAGKTGGNGKARKTKENAPSNATALPEQCPSNQNQNQNHIYSVTNVTDGGAVAALSQGEIDGEKAGRIEPSDIPENATAPDLPGVGGVFADGVGFLTRNGVAERQARSMIGRWRMDHRDDEILSAFRACADSGAVDPIPWITRHLQPAATFKPDFSKWIDQQ